MPHDKGGPVKAALIAEEHTHSTPDLRDDASTSSGPTWYLDARPLDTCHDDHADEWAIECPGGPHEALAWRSRPGRSTSGWACPSGHRGPLWGLLPRAAS